jgi:O-antigen/teichoic acid export membrane protein
VDGSERSGSGLRGEAGGIARNAATSYALRGLMIVSALLLTPYLYRRLGAGGFGTWSVIFTFQTVFNLVEFGLAGGLIKLVAEQRGAGRQHELGATLAAGVLALAGFGVLAVVASIVVAFGLDGLADAGSRADYRVGMVVIGVAMLVRFPLVAYGAALIGYQRSDLFNYATAVSIGGFPIAAVAAVELGGGVAGVSVALAATLVAGAALYVPLLRHEDPAIPLLPRRGGRVALRRLASFSTYTLLADSMVFVGQRMDTVVIAAVRSAATAAPFAAAVKLQSGVQSFSLPFVNLLLPMIAELDAAGRRPEVGRRLVLATRIAAQLTIPVAAAIAIFSEDIVDLWLGDTAPAETAGIVAVLMAAAVLSLSAAPAEKILVGVGRVRLMGIIATVEGLLNITISIQLVVELGAIGAAWGTLITTAVLSPVKLPMAARAVGVPVRRLLRDAVLAPLAASAAGLAVMAVVALALPEGFLRLVLGAGAGVLACAAVAAMQVGPRRLREVRGLLRARSSPAIGGVS